MRLAVDGNAAYHLMHNAVKSQNIRSGVELRILGATEALITTRLYALSLTLYIVVVRNLKCNCILGKGSSRGSK